MWWRHKDTTQQTIQTTSGGTEVTWLKDTGSLKPLLCDDFYKLLNFLFISYVCRRCKKFDKWGTECKSMKNPDKYLYVCNGNMNVHFCSHLKHHSWFLQQIRPHVGTDDAVAAVKANLDVFTKTTAVVISSGLCISNGLSDRSKKQMLKHTLHSEFI